MTPEEEMILFSVLQDIADELRKIRRERQKAEMKEKQRQAEFWDSKSTRDSIPEFFGEAHNAISP